MAGNSLAKLGHLPRDREGVCANSIQLSSSGLTGRSSIPEAALMEPRSRGVLDRPVKPGDDSLNER
jgi:hypothetical protein